MQWKYFFLLGAFSLFALSNNYGQTKTNALTNSVSSQSNYVKILEQFEAWKKVQYTKGKYAPPNKCNDEGIVNGGAEEGIPDYFTIYYGHINDDDNMDALITFNPVACSGGNALMNAETKLLILSEASEYRVDDQFFEKIEQQLNSGWIIVNGAGFQTIFGTYYDFKNDDARCCPSIRRDIQIDVKSKKLEFVDR